MYNEEYEKKGFPILSTILKVLIIGIIILLLILFKNICCSWFTFILSTNLEAKKVIIKDIFWSKPYTSPFKYESLKKLNLTWTNLSEHVGS